MGARNNLAATYGEALNAVQRFRQLADYTGDPVSLSKAQRLVAQASAVVEAVGSKFVFA